MVTGNCSSRVHSAQGLVPMCTDVCYAYNVDTAAVGQLILGQLGGYGCGESEFIAPGFRRCSQQVNDMMV